MKKLGSFFNRLENPKILDVGTGNGNFIKIIQSLTDNFESIIGIDQLDIAINTSQKNFTDERISFQKMDAFNMDFKDDTFDLVCLSNSLHHLRDVNGMLKEMARVLKPGGFLLINEMMSDNLNARQKSHLKVHHFAAEIDRELGEVHNDTYKAKEILELLAKESELTIKDAWDLKQPRSDSNSQEEITWLLETVDKLAQRVKDEKKQEEYLKKATKIKKYIKRVGFDSATQLVVLLK